MWQRRRGNLVHSSSGRVTVLLFEWRGRTGRLTLLLPWVGRWADAWLQREGMWVDVLKLKNPW